MFTFWDNGVVLHDDTMFVGIVSGGAQGEVWSFLPYQVHLPSVAAGVEP